MTGAMPHTALSEAFIPVTAAPVFDPEGIAASLELPVGLTIAEIVAVTLPDVTEADWPELRVTLVTGDGQIPIEPAMWRLVRPNAGVKTVIRIRPGGSDSTLRSILIAVVSVAAMAIGAWAAPLLVPTAGLAQTLVQGLIVAGITIAGSLLVNALIPPAEDKKEAATYSINGWRNEARLGGPVPLVLGKHRMAPVFAAGSYTEIVNGQQFVRALFTFGYGRLDISDIRIGDTPLSEFDEVDTEIREGTDSDAPVTLYPRQVIEEAMGVELVRPLPRNNAGKVIEGDPSIETPVVRYTATDSWRASIIVAFQSGLFRVDDAGDVRSKTVKIRIRQRAEGASTWSTVETLSISARKREAFFSQYTWTLPSRGTWEIEVTRMTDESDSNQVSDRSWLVALQSIRPEYPLNFGKPLALIAIRIRATYQLSGNLDNVNALVQRYGPVWNGTTWSTGLTRNPASAYRTLLQSNANPYPVADSGIDLDQIEDWYEFCEAKGLKYDRIHQDDETLGEALTIASVAGRAAPRHDGIAWGVVIDRPEDLVVDHVNPRNSSGITWSRTYFDPPDAFRVTFADETNDYKLGERIVPWPMHTGDIDLTETLEMPGKTDPDEIWIEARRRMYELLHRPDTFTATQDGQARVVTRGDQVMGSFDVLSSTQIAARVKSVTGALIELDEEASMESGTDYAIRFRVFADASDTIGTSVVRQVAFNATPTRSVRVLDPDSLPEAGDLVHFGPLASESLALKVKAVERGEGFSSVLRMVSAAPEIDTLTDAEVPPAWNARVGAEIYPDAITLDPPSFVAVEHGLVGTGDPDGLRVLFAVGGSTMETVSVRIEHKLSSASSYDSTTVPAADGGADITGYTAGDSVVLRLVGIAADASESVPTATFSLVIGADDPPVPGALEEASIIVSGLLGNSQIVFATGIDSALARVQIYRVPTGDTLDRDIHAVGAPIPVTANTTFAYSDGDGTRENLVRHGGFDSGADWTLDTNWAVGSDVATHTTGAADTIRQAITLSAGKTYRGAVTLSGRTAGSLTPTLFGGTNQTDTAIAADGASYFEIAAVTGNTDLGFTATTDFDGSIDDVIAFLTTPSCVPQGTYDYYLEPQNDLGGAGTISSAFTVTVI